MRVLLIYPLSSQESPQMTPPLSILYIGAYCKRRGIDVDYFDDRWDTDLENKILKADIVGVSSMSGFQLKNALKYLNTAHDLGKITVMGGVHCTIAPEQCIEQPFIDFVVVGEGEDIFYNLINNLNAPEKVKGIWYKNKYRKILYTGKHTSLLPENIESPIDEETIRYFKLSSVTKDVMLPASRGCMSKCAFCYNSVKPDGGKWRPISLSVWEEDIKKLIYNNIDISYMQVGDDWLGGKNRILGIGKLMYKYNIKWNLSIRANQIDEDLVSKFKDINCIGVSVGVESGSEEILQLMQKGITIKDIINAANILKKYNIKPLYYFILGVPTETPIQMNDTFKLIDNLNEIHNKELSVAVYGFDPLIGTKLYYLADSLGQYVPKTLEECCVSNRNNTKNYIINNIYYIAGLTFHRGKGDKTDKNFPGIRRLLIYPFEIICYYRWKYRKFKYFNLEIKLIKFILKRLSKKYTK